MTTDIIKDLDTATVYADSATAQAAKARVVAEIEERDRTIAALVEVLRAVERRAHFAGLKPPWWDDLRAVLADPVAAGARERWVRKDGT